MAAGLLLRAAAYAGLASSATFPAVLAWTALIGLGSALYMPAGKAALARLAPPNARVVTFSLRNTSINVGVAIGPPLGLAAAAVSYKAALLTSAGLFLVLLALTLVLVPRDAPSRPGAHMRLGDLPRLAGEPRVATLAIVMALFFAFYVQMELTMPLFAEMHFSKAAAGLLFTVNAIAVIALQLPLSGWMSRVTLYTALPLGLAAIGTGFALLSAPFGLGGFLIGVFVFTLGEIIIEPKIDAEIGRIVEPRALGASFGLLSLASSVGGAAGNYVGSVGLEWGRATGGDARLWLILSAAAFATAAALFMALQRIFVAELPATATDTEAV